MAHAVRRSGGIARRLQERGASVRPAAELARRGVHPHPLAVADVLGYLDLDAGAQLRRLRALGRGAALELGWRVDHRSEVHTSEIQSLMRISSAVFSLKKKRTHAN